MRFSPIKTIILVDGTPIISLSVKELVGQGINTKIESLIGFMVILDAIIRQHPIRNLRSKNASI